MIPAVTVVVPLFDKAPTVARAIGSVCAQTRGDFELIVVDDGSRDRGPAIVESIGDPRVRLVRQANSGPGAARNRGAREARAPLVAFLDADDEWRPRYLETALAAFARDPGIAAYACAYDGTAGAGRHRHPLEGLVCRAGILRLPEAASAAIIKAHVDGLTVSCLTVRRDIFLRRGGFFAEPGSRFGEDSFLLIQYLLGERIWFDPARLVEIHFEDSAIGLANRGRQPIHPALLRAERLRTALSASAEPQLAALLALYRRRFTRRLASAGRWRDIRLLRRRFPSPGPRGMRDWAAELRIDLRCLLGCLGLSGRGPAPDFAPFWLDEQPTAEGMAGGLAKMVQQQ